MRAIVVFLVGIGLVVYGKYVSDNDLQYAGCIFFALGLIGMVASWFTDESHKQKADERY